MANKPSAQKGGDSVISSSRPIVISSEAYAQSLDRLAKVGNRVKEEKFDPKKHKDTKRSQIALIFVRGYIIIISLIIIGAPLFNALLSDAKTPIDIERLLSQVGSLIGAPLGFVIGYYFKEDK